VYCPRVSYVVYVPLWSVTDDDRRQRASLVWPSYTMCRQANNYVIHHQQLPTDQTVGWPAAASFSWWCCCSMVDDTGTPTPSYLSERLHPTSLLAPCDHPPPLTCTSLALISISVHARFILQLQQSGILSILHFIRLKP